MCLGAFATALRGNARALLQGYSSLDDTLMSRGDHMLHFSQLRQNGKKDRQTCRKDFLSLRSGTCREGLDPCT